MKITFFDSVFLGSVRPNSNLLVLKIGGYVMQFKKMYKTSNTHYLADNQKPIFIQIFRKIIVFFSFFHLFMLGLSGVTLWTKYISGW